GDLAVDAEFGSDFVNTWVGHISPVWGPPQMQERTLKGEGTHFELLISCPLVFQPVLRGLSVLVRMSDP
ncbi:MAG TPA: hypothetical protein VGM70_12065, partial [Pseudolysinimonas sp.]